MKQLFLFLLTTFIPLASAANAQSCQPDPIWPNLKNWVCIINGELTRRDEGKDYLRASELITDLAAIAEVRAAARRHADDTCRSFHSPNLDKALKRILNHQALPESFAPDPTGKAASEIADAGNGSEVISCETQIISENERQAQYSSLYYLKFGSIRAGKHLIVRVTTTWNR